MSIDAMSTTVSTAVSTDTVLPARTGSDFARLSRRGPATRDR